MNHAQSFHLPYPYLIAEAGVNHQGSIETAIEMVRAVARSGWNAIKFQTYSAETLAAKTLSPSYWDTKEESETSQFELFSKFRKFTDGDFQLLRKEADKNGVELLNTFFDHNELRAFGKEYPLVKIASADVNNLPLLRVAASLGRPVLLSVGAATDKEIEKAMTELSTYGTKLVIPMHCVLNYPTREQDANLWRISQIKKVAPTVGYSDHTRYHPDQSIFTPTVAVLLGAKVIEKHFTLDRSLQGNDHYHSADEQGLKSMKEQILQALKLTGKESSDFLSGQDLARNNARRRIFVRSEVEEGQVIQEKSLIPLRANSGLSIDLWDEVIGRLAKKKLTPGSPLESQDLN